MEGFEKDINQIAGSWIDGLLKQDISAAYQQFSDLCGQNGLTLSEVSQEDWSTCYDWFNALGLSGEVYKKLVAISFEIAQSIAPKHREEKFIMIALSHHLLTYGLQKDHLGGEELSSYVGRIKALANEMKQS